MGLVLGVSFEEFGNLVSIIGNGVIFVLGWCFEFVLEIVEF